MKKIYLILLVLLCNIVCQSQTSVKNMSNIKLIDNYVLKLMKDYDITGSAVAILKNNKVIHQNYYGYANKEFSVPVDENTLFKLHSVTKPIISTAIFRLIEQGEISLNDPISKYFVIDKKFDSITIAHLLAHTSGLREIEKNRTIKEFNNVNRVFGSELQFTPGEYFQYAATNYWLLQKITEKVTNQNFQDYIANQYFDGEKEAVIFSADILEVVPNRTFEYYPNKFQELALFEWYLPEYAYAAGALNITLNRMVSWAQSFNENEFINQKTKTKMWQQYPYRNDNSRRSYGWEINMVNGLNSYGHDGGGISYLQIIPEQNITVIFLSNGYRQKYVSFNIATSLASTIDKKLHEPFISVYQKLDVAFNNMNTKEIKYLVGRLQVDENYKNINIEDVINQLGYQRLYHYEFPRYKDAIKVFKFNTQEYPNSWNGYDSLGEAYESYKNIESAIKSYQTAIKLNSTNEQKNNDRLEKRIDNLKKM